MKNKKVKTNLYKKLGLLGVGLCALCCLLPIIGVVIGIGSLAIIGFYLEKIMIVLIGTGVILFIFLYYYKKRKKKCKDSCSVDCECKTQ